MGKRRILHGERLGVGGPYEKERKKREKANGSASGEVENGVKLTYQWGGGRSLSGCNRKG